MSSENQEEIIQYVPFISFVHPSFWHTFTEDKLDVAKLNDGTKEIHGRFSYRADIKTVFEVDGTSFNSEPQEEPFYINVVGTIMNKNTIEGFKELDKALFLNSIGDMVWFNVRRKIWIESPGILLNFFILSFADLKKFNYYYWFTFPCPSQPTVYMVGKPAEAKATFSEEQLSEITEGFKALPHTQKCFFFVHPEESKMSVYPLNHFIDKDTSQMTIDTDVTYFAFADPSNGENPGWPLRMLIAALLQHYEDLPGRVLKVLALRCTPSGACDESLVYNIKIPMNVDYSESSGWIGWERNDKGNFGPRLSNMSASMDPMILADTSSDLNIKLMKWRLVPELDIHIFKETKCLLLGAGTLGCHVARNLMGWGFRHITFVDSGKVSYSNPTRQVLFNYKDCLSGGRYKAEAAADNLKDILPTMKSRGVVLHIPMPGHPVGESLKKETSANYNTLCKEIAEHDVIFLLLDTREARWLPTLVAASEQKVHPMLSHPLGESLKKETSANYNTLCKEIAEHDVIFLLLDTREARWLPTLVAASEQKVHPMPCHPVGESLKKETSANYNTLCKEIAEHDVIFLLLDTREARWLPTLVAASEQKVHPMPCHPVGESLKKETSANYNTLCKEIAEHDVIFLLLDTREARWLPTLVAASEQKIVINAALGFDSYLVMRHGIGLVPLDESAAMSRPYVPGGQLGCYFCNDVTAPGNSLKERTLDQQCTVSRPGAAAVAGALAVELLASLLQHPLKSEAPAVYNITEDGERDPQITQGHLGLVPHSIRGFLHSFQTVVPTCTKFKQCIACSDIVINKFKDRGEEFVFKVLETATYLEYITGLTELQMSADMTDVLTFSDEDEQDIDTE